MCTFRAIYFNIVSVYIEVKCKFPGERLHWIMNDLFKGLPRAYRRQHSAGFREIRNFSTISEQLQRRAFHLCHPCLFAVYMMPWWAKVGRWSKENKLQQFTAVRCRHFCVSHFLLKNYQLCGNRWYFKISDLACFYIFGISNTDQKWISPWCWL